MRPSFESIYMKLAYALAERSTCARLHVGCVVTSADYRKVLAVGYNGNYAGGPHRCDSEEPGACGCLHAEDNAVINCEAPREQRKLVFVTHMPCTTCAKRIVNLGGVERVIYGENYRLKDSLKIFGLSSIACEVCRVE